MRRSVGAQRPHRTLRRLPKTTTPFRPFVSETNQRAGAGSPRLQEFFRAMVEARRSFRTRYFSPAPALRRRVSVALADRKASGKVAWRAACALNFDTRLTRRSRPTYPSVMPRRLLRICLLTVACVSLGASHVEQASQHAGSCGQDTRLT